jgi:hypothetical protein
MLERLETLGQQVKAAQDAVERAPDVVSGVSDGNIAANWESIRTDWRNIRDRLELSIQQIGHKSKRDKYSRLDRYSYIKVIQALLGDEVIRAPIAADLMQMNSKFLALRRRTNVATAADLAEFRRWFGNVNSALPELPG